MRLATWSGSRFNRVPVILIVSIPRHRQVLLSFRVSLEGAATAVVLPAVEFHRESLFLPVEVELVALDEVVDGGPWHVCVGKSRQHSLLAAGSREAGLSSSLSMTGRSSNSRRSARSQARSRRYAFASEA
jgi:hypothetical protein